MTSNSESTQPVASHFVGGEFVDDPNGETLHDYCPATGEVIATLNSASVDLVNRCVEVAKAAQVEWAAMSGAERGRILRKAAQLIRERNRELSILETRDTGKALQETLVADAASGADCLDFFGNLAASIDGETVELGNNYFYTRREPLGVCVGIGAWNYPIQIA